MLEASGAGKGNSKRRTGTRGRSIGRARFLGSSFSSGSKGLNRLSKETRRNFLAIQTVTFRPLVRIVVSPEKLINPGKMNGEVLIDALFLRSMVPMMVSGHDQKLFDPFCIGTKIAMSPGSMKGHKDQVCQDNGLRKSK